jgi:hypothetical protein
MTGNRTTKANLQETARGSFLELLRVAYWPTSGKALDAEVRRLQREPLYGQLFLVEGRAPARDDLDADTLGLLDQASAVVDDLADEPLALYRILAEGCVYPITWHGLGTTEDRSEASQRILKKTLTRWAARWGLEADWCLRAALATLWQWHTDSASLEDRRWGAFHQVQPRSGGPGGPRRRPWFPERLIWLVRYQILGEHIQHIAATAGHHARTVGGAIKTLAKELELPLRHTPGGRAHDVVAPDLSP